jgi:hypothetical protein
MGRLMSAIIAFLEAEGWKHWKASSRPTVMLFVEANFSHWICIIEARERQEQAVVRTLYSPRMPAGRIPAVLQYITRANTHLTIGNFELDLDEGTLAYKTSLDVAGTELTPELVRGLIENSVAAADLHFPGIMAVMFGAKSPREALDEVLDRGERYPIAEVVDIANDLYSE